jgi:DNA polymerase (family 10)
MATNADVAAVFNRMADLMEIQGANAFRIRAFRRVAQAVENLSESTATMLERGTLKKVPGIGDGAVKRIGQILQTGTCDDLKELMEALPPGLYDLLQISGLGPKKVKLFYDELGISSVDELESAARAGHLAQLPRMGKKSEQKLLTAIEGFRRRTGRTPLPTALELGRKIIAELAKLDDVLQIELAGSCRRGRETIGDLDVLVAAHDPTVVMDTFGSLEDVTEVMLRGDTKTSVRLDNGMQADLRVLEPESFGAALHYFTGSQMHNIAVRDRAKRQGLRVNEYGVFKEPSGERVCGKTEKEVFESVGLCFIPPELRENRGEIEAAENGTLPDLLTLDQLRGDLHTHTRDSDGKADAKTMALAAQKLGHEMLAITDHTDAVAVVSGLDGKALLAQKERLEGLQDELELRLLCGIEVDIMPDGSLSIEADILRQMDWVVGSVHLELDMDGEAMTKRIITAFESGLIDCLAHPCGRWIGEREAHAADLDAVVDAAARCQVALELNASPTRLDLNANYCRQAKDRGVMIALNSDAHDADQIGRVELGVITARRGWLEAKDVLNARPVNEVLDWITARRR